MRTIALSLIIACAVASEPERTVGGYETVAVTNAEVVAAAGFAIQSRQAQSTREGRKESWSLSRIRRAEQQVVAGMNYRLQLDVSMDGRIRDVEAVVWSQPWNQDTPYRLTDWQLR